MTSAMIPTLLFLLGPVGVQPVRVRLERTGGSLLVHVQSTVDGYLTVMRREADGSVRVLFPSDPTRSAFVRAGNYTLTAAGDQAGTIVAAVSCDALHFGEFVNGSRWDGASLSAIWYARDGEAVLTDIVQRMLGDGSFNYDGATYGGSTEQVSYLPPEGLPIGVDTLQCDPYYADCFPFIHVRRPEPARAVSSPVSQPGSTLAAYYRGQPAEAVAPRGLIDLPPLVIIQARRRSREEPRAEPGQRTDPGVASAGPRAQPEPQPSNTPAFAYVGAAVPRPAPRAPTEAALTPARVTEPPHTMAATHAVGYGVGTVRLVEAHR